MGIFDRIAGSLDNLGAPKPDSPAAAKEEIELAMAFADRGDLGEAERRLREITLRFPRLPLGFARLGELLARRGGDEDAAAAYGRAVDLDPDDLESWFGLGERLARLGRFEPARDALRRALSLAVDPLQRGRAHAALGNLYAQAGRLGKAARELGKAVQLVPSDMSAAADYGRVLARTGDPEAATWLARAAAAPGADPRLTVEAAIAAETNQTVGAPAPAADAGETPAAETPTAEQLLRQALARAPAEVAVRAALSGLLTRAGRHADGLALALEAVDAAPSDPDAMRALRESYAAAGRFIEALEAARREAELGDAPPFDRLLPLALGAQDRVALGALAETPREGEPTVAAALRAFLARSADETQLVALAAHAPDEASRRFIVEGLTPARAPAGNLFALLGYAHELASRTPELWAQAVPTARAAEAYDRPLLIAVMGEFNAGKSSFVNALVGEEIAPVGVTPTTATINILRHGPKGGRVIYHDGTARELDAASVAPFLRQLGSGSDATAVRLVEIFHPLEILRRVEIVDTPGLNSLRAEHETVARGFLVEADAIVWLFAVGQAAKATEKQALGLARSAGKRVLGVLSKIDRASAEEVAEVARHVSATLGDLVEAVVPISARRALAERGRGRDGDSDSGDSGFAALQAALEERFFRHARELKRTTALGALRRFIADARRASAAPAAPQAERDFAAELRALGQVEERLRGTVAAERVALRARIAEAYRSAAFEVREFVRPRSWLFGEHKVDASDEEFLIDLLDDAIVRANAQSRAALTAALSSAGDDQPPPAAVVEACERASERAFDRFSAYARGVIEGGAVPEFFRQDLPRIRLDLGAIRSALARRVPDPEDVLFRALDRELGRLFRDARRELGTAEAGARVRALIQHERLVRPLDDLARAVENLTARGDEPPPAATTAT